MQMDFKTKLLCSIQKGLVKRQLPFSLVKSCDDGAGSRFSISFKGHHDYELEATSLEDKHKVELHCLTMIFFFFNAMKLFYWIRSSGRGVTCISVSLSSAFLSVCTADHAARESDHL